MQRYAFQIFYLGTFLMFGFLACQHDPFLAPDDPNNPVIDPNNPETPVITGGCSPDSVYFQNQILPILVSNCTESGCHNVQDHQDGVILDSYQNLVNTVGHATQNDLHGNKLMRALLETDPDKRMPPPPKSALPQAQINLLKTWLAQGAQDNACDENSGGCDASSVRFSTFVQPLVQAKCQGCHSGSNPQGNIKLVSYTDVKAVALNGRMYAALTRSSNWMPKGGTKLDDCSLQKIQAWIGAGAPEN